MSERARLQQLLPDVRGIPQLLDNELRKPKCQYPAKLRDHFGIFSDWPETLGSEHLRTDKLLPGLRHFHLQPVQPVCSERDFQAPQLHGKHFIVLDINNNLPILVELW